MTKRQRWIPFVAQTKYVWVATDKATDKCGGYWQKYALFVGIKRSQWRKVKANDPR